MWKNIYYVIVVLQGRAQTLQFLLCCDIPSSCRKAEYECDIARLCNSLPKYLRDIESVNTEKFKFELDKFQELIPDEPKMPKFVTASGSNSILDQLTHLRARGIYQSGGVADSAMEQS